MSNGEPADAAPVTLVGWLRGSSGLRPVAKSGRGSPAG